jgi:hypothetical protein
LGEDFEHQAQAAGDFSAAEEDGEGLGHLDALGAGCGVFAMAVAAGDEDQADHEAHEEQAKVGEAG